MLQWFAVGLVGFAVYLFTLRGFYSLKDTRTPFLANLVENGVNVALAFALVGHFRTRAWRPPTPRPTRWPPSPRCCW